MFNESRSLKRQAFKNNLIFRNDHVVLKSSAYTKSLMIGIIRWYRNMIFSIPLEGSEPYQSIVQSDPEKCQNSYVYRQKYGYFLWLPDNRTIVWFCFYSVSCHWHLRKHLVFVPIIKMDHCSCFIGDI